MSKVNIPVGTSSFAEIRQEGYYYIDKTGLIEEILRTESTKVTLITRPRRFGKTLGMRMLAEFFDRQKDSRGLFAGLSIEKNKELCAAWMNQYPTLFISFKGVDGLNFSAAYARLAAVISELYKKHLYLIEDDKINRYDREMFHRIAAKTASAEEVGNSLFKLTQMMAFCYGRPVILLMDEYDVPLAKASEKGYYAEMLDVMKGIMQVIKDNDALKFAVITGCLYIAKESIFTGTNNFVSDTISDTRLNEYFGFTQAEVETLLQDTGLSGHREEMKAWYDGYCFGAFHVYCPWDVMNHVKNLMLNPLVKPAGYWKNSSDNAIIRAFIDFSGESITQRFERLLAGDCVFQRIKDDLTYDMVHSSEENLWSILYLTGYLTGAGKAGTGEEESGQRSEGRCIALKIPNAEIMEIFEHTIKSWFEERVQHLDRKKLFAALWNGNAQTAAEEMSGLLRKTISYHDYREDFYHAFFAGIFAGAGYVVESNKEHGEGRSDIVVKDYAGDRVIVFEVKYAKALSGLADECKKAIAQIDRQRYAQEFEEEYSQVICYGISFYKKRCLLQRKE